MKALNVSNVLPAGWLDLFAQDQPRIGIGLDPATTTKETSNPTGITITQQVSLMYFARLVLRLKTGDPDVIEYLLRQILQGLRGRGLSARRLCIAATNERFFSITMRKKLAPLVPVELVIESEKLTYLGEEMLYKAYLGNLFVNTIDDGYLALPPAEWLKKDIRLVVKDRGTFNAELGEDGGHGDTFVSTGLSLHALKTKGGPAVAAGAPVGTFAAKPGGPQRKFLNPYAARFQHGGRARIAT